MLFRKVFKLLIKQKDSVNIVKKTSSPTKTKTHSKAEIVDLLELLRSRVFVFKHSFLVTITVTFWWISYF